MNDVLLKCQASTSHRIKWLLEMENTAPFTMDEYHYKTYREQFLHFYRHARFPYPEDEEFSDTESPYTPYDESQSSYDQALHHMASARSYFQGSHKFWALIPRGLFTIPSVAYKRFTDMVPMLIDQELLRGLDWDRGLHTTLTKGLEITGPGSLEKAKAYLQEPPDVRSRRETLLKKRERLQFAKRELQSI